MFQKHIDVWPGSEPIKEEAVPVTRLDTLADELRVSCHRTLLKIDVQGYERNVLRGADATLRHITAVYVELLFCPLYEGQAKYYEVMSVLDLAGFRFAGLYESDHDHKTGEMLFANGLFISRSA
jgi:hypothetical protein